MAELAATDALTDETRAELDTLESGTPDLERQLRAARQVAEAEAEGTAEVRETTETGEDRELRELRSKVQLSGYVSAAIEQRSADGAEAEYNQARGIAGNRFPLELLSPPEQREVTGRRHRDDAENVVGSAVFRHRCRGRRRQLSKRAARADEPPRYHDGRDGGAARKERSC